jgi:hypothetical protein
MDRRTFIGTLVGGLVMEAARVYPFSVYSFPKEIIIAPRPELRIYDSTDVSWSDYPFMGLLRAPDSPDVAVSLTESHSSRFGQPIELI